MIRTRDARVIAAELHSRYEPLRAVTLVARLLMKALFAGRSTDVVFWALVNAYYNGDEICEGDPVIDFHDLADLIARDHSGAN